MEEGRETDEEAGYLHQDPTDPSRELDPPQSLYQGHRTPAELPVRCREEITLHKNQGEVDVGSEQQLVSQVFITLTLEDCLKYVDNVLVNHPSKPVRSSESAILYV